MHLIVRGSTIRGRARRQPRKTGKPGQATFLNSRPMWGRAVFSLKEDLRAVFPGGAIAHGVPPRPCGNAMHGSAARERKASHADAPPAECHDATGFQFIFKRRQAFQDDARVVLGSNDVRLPKENERRFRAAPHRKQDSKVGVRGDDGTIFARGSFQDCAVFGGLKAVVANVNRVVARVSKKPCHVRRGRYQSGISQRQEFHAGRGTASSRSMAEDAAKRRHS